MIKYLPLMFTLLLSTTVKADRNWIDSSRHKGLDRAAVQVPFNVYATSPLQPQHLPVLKRLTKAKAFFDSQFAVDLPFAVMMLDNAHWESIAYYPPPGMPQAWKGNIILGLDNSAMASKVRNALTPLPADIKSSLFQTYGKELNLDRFYRDILAIHELAHLYHFYEGTTPQRKWLQELFATLAMVTFVHNRCVECFEEMDVYPQFILSSGKRGIEYTSLNNFETMYLPGLGPKNYEWFQMHFYQWAQEILAQDGEEALVKLRRFIIDTDLSSTTRMDNETLINQLRENVSSHLATLVERWESTNATSTQ